MEHPPLVAALLCLLPVLGCVGDIGAASVGQPVDAVVDPRAPSQASADGVGVPFAVGPSPQTRLSEVVAPETSPTSTTVRGCPPDVVFCDDFEGGSIDSGVWETETREGAEVAVGEGVLRLSLPSADGARALIRPQGVVSLLGDRFWGRFYMRTDPGVEMVHSYVMNAVGTLDGSRAYYGLHSNQGRLNSRYVASHVEEHGGWKKHGDHTLPAEWTCIELHFDLERGAMSFFFDGEEDVLMRVDESDSPPWTGPELTRIDFGFQTYQAAASGFEVLYDGIAFDTDRIGCD